MRGCLLCQARDTSPRNLYERGRGSRPPSPQWRRGPCPCWWWRPLSLFLGLARSKGLGVRGFQFFSPSVREVFTSFTHPQYSSEQDTRNTRCGVHLTGALYLLNALLQGCESKFCCQKRISLSVIYMLSATLFSLKWSPGLFYQHCLWRVGRMKNVNMEKCFMCSLKSRGASIFFSSASLMSPAPAWS